MTHSARTELECALMDIEAALRDVQTTMVELNRTREALITMIAKLDVSTEINDD